MDYKTKLEDLVDQANVILSQIVHGGEFADWLIDQTMPFAAAKELDDLVELAQRVRELKSKLKKANEKP